MIFNKTQRAITLIQLRRLEAELKVLIKRNQRSPIERAQKGGLKSVIAELKSDIQDFDSRLVKNKAYHR